MVENGLFDPDVHRTEDFDLWFRLAKNEVKIGYQKKILLKYRVRLSGLTGNNIERAERTIKALELVKSKNNLTDSETRVWQDRVKISEAEIRLKKAKDFSSKRNLPKPAPIFRKRINITGN